jgi:ABC-type lipopolysaccharide export system ATPase subunit
MYLRARKGINYLAQEPSVFRKLTVEQNLLAILETLDIPARERKLRLKKLLTELDIAHLAKQKAARCFQGGSAAGWKLPVPWSQSRGLYCWMNRLRELIRSY